jgi:ABC-type Na+ transport system ATPase subunit NatA
MVIEEIGIKNFKSFGNARQSVTLNTEKGGLILLVGNNGMGKSLVKTTEIEVDIPIEKFNLQELNNFLEIMGTENNYIEYIRENNSLLYEKYLNQ